MRVYYQRPKFRFYPQEVRDFTIAVLVLTLAMAFLLSGGISSLAVFYLYLPVAFLAVITAFFMHELSHKYVAFKYGYPAAFRAWNVGLFIALISGFFGFLFAAPGAVMVYGYPRRDENGKISVAGPISNMILGSIFLGGGFFISSLTNIFMIIAYLNFFLAFFNLLPIPPMDGLKVLHWNIGIYISLFILSVFTIVSWYVI